VISSGSGPGEILRATIFHTSRNAFREDALDAYADDALLVRDGCVSACGDFAGDRSAHPDAAVRDLRGGFLLPGLIDTHVQPGKAADLVYVRPQPDTPLAANLERTDDLNKILTVLFTLADAECIREVWMQGTRAWSRPI
jgi:cytosine/adenosine deaminase-related metal-dependent hydrolase